MLNLKVNRNYSIVTIVNWGKYQGDTSEGESQSESKVNQKRIKNESKLNTNKNKNKGVEDSPLRGGLDTEKIMGEAYEPNKLFYKEDGEEIDWDTVWLYEDLWGKRRNE